MTRLPKKTRPTGVINLDYFEDRFVFKRFDPSPRLVHFVDFYWSIQWEIDEGVHTQDVVPHPAVNLTFLESDSRITGISKKLYSHTLVGKGRLIGTKFCPAGFYPFAKKSGLALPDMVDRRFDVSSVFEIDVDAFELEILNLREPQEQISKIECEMFKKVPDVDDNITFLNDLVLRIENDSSITSVEKICEIFCVGERKLQRLFTKYIGVSPKWVIQRYRLQKALGKIENGESIVWSDLALDLGYYDQSHFIKNFQKFFGKNPVDLYEKIKKKSEEVKQ